MPCVRERAFPPSTPGWLGLWQDGETAAGSRLAHLLDIVQAEGVVVVVSRWYGGIQLGPDRFKHINNVARALLESTGAISAPPASASA